MQKYYYKYKDSKRILSTKTPINNDNGDYIQISKEEFETLDSNYNTNNYESNINKEKLFRINYLKSKLFETDYQAIKFAEGVLTEEEYSPVKAQRQAWRAEINQLEGEIYEKINH